VSSATTHTVPLSREPAWWGMLLLVATEAALFLLLLASYFFLRFNTPGHWPPAGVDQPKLLKSGIMTALLMTSSVPAYLAEQAIRRGNVARLKTMLGATLLLGSGFLALQAWEYSEKLAKLRPSDNAYGSIFYTITGLHGAHVIVGLLLLLWALILAWRGAYDAERHLAVQNVSLYWHFVHAVWLFVFASLYLSPRL
jgi:heme/copper-type cytochrome/quinol oxidase subunit 3